MNRRANGFNGVVEINTFKLLTITIKDSLVKYVAIYLQTFFLFFFYFFIIDLVIN